MKKETIINLERRKEKKEKKKKKEKISRQHSIDIVQRSQVLAKEDSVFQRFKEIIHVPVGVYVLAGDRFDPFQTFLRQFLAVFAVDLQQKCIYDQSRFSSQAKLTNARWNDRENKIDRENAEIFSSNGKDSVEGKFGLASHLRLFRARRCVGSFKRFTSIFRARRGTSHWPPLVINYAMCQWSK